MGWARGCWRALIPAPERRDTLRVSPIDPNRFSWLNSHSWPNSCDFQVFQVSFISTPSFLLLPRLDFLWEERGECFQIWAGIPSIPIPPVPLGHSRCHPSSSGVLLAEGFFPVKLHVLVNPILGSKNHWVLYLWFLVSCPGRCCGTERFWVWLQSLVWVICPEQISLGIVSTELGLFSWFQHSWPVEPSEVGCSCIMQEL